MSAFDVWLWLKLDDMRQAMLIVFVLFGCAGLFFGVMISCPPDAAKLKTRVLVLSLAAMGWLAGAAYTITPSTKQAAAIYVVPQLVESRVFTNDIPQLYGMAVDALKEKLAVEASK